MVVVVVLSDRSRLLRVASVSHHRHFLTLIFLGNFWVRALPEMQGVPTAALPHPYWLLHPSTSQGERKTFPPREN